MLWIRIQSNEKMSLEIFTFAIKFVITFRAYRMPWQISKILQFDTIRWRSIEEGQMIRCYCLVIRKYSTPDNNPF